MDALESFYELDFGSLNFFERKCHIDHPRTLLFGAPKSGKTYVLQHTLGGFKKSETLYLDLKDARIDPESELSKLQRFIDQKKIRHVAIDGYREGDALPECETLLLGSDSVRMLEGFQTAHIHTLDFEEYVAFEKKYSGITQTYNAFLRDGSLPEMPFIPANKRIQRLREILRLICEKEYEYRALTQLLQYSGDSITAHQQFSVLKQSTKISKDKFYESLKSLQYKEILFLIEKFAQPNAPKKLYAFDFTLKNAVSFEKDLLGTLENMIFLELFKRGETLFYLDGIDFYLPEHGSGILDMPFASKEKIEAKLERTKETLHLHGITQMSIITVGFELFDAEYSGIAFDAIPFWMWAVGE